MNMTAAGDLPPPLAPTRSLSAVAAPFAPPFALQKVAPPARAARDTDEPARRRRGVIVDNLKDTYGSVRLDDAWATEHDLFVHLTDCTYEEPRAGDRVSFAVAPYQNRTKAVDVELVARLAPGLEAPKNKPANEMVQHRFPVPLREQVACALFAWVAWAPRAGVPPRVELDTADAAAVEAFFAATP